MTPFGEYLPDMPGDISTIISGKNLYPRATGTYGSVAAFATAVASLAARCQGSLTALDSAGNVSVWAGTATKLYKEAGAGASTFSDVSIVAGYTTGSTESWEFAQYGQKVFASNFADPIQTYTLGTSTLFANLSATAPKARHIAVVNNFLMAGNTFDATDSNQPDRLWWSAIGDPTNWPTPATSAAAAVQSGFINIRGPGGWIQGIAPRIGALDAIVVQERALLRCQYVGSPDVFAIQPLEGGRGSPAPNSITAFGGFMFYLGEDGFYACDGAQSIPIGAGKVDKTFWANVNQNFMNRICGVFDPINHLWLVGYPSVSSTSGNIDKILAFSPITKRWAPPWDVSIEWLTKLGSIGYTLEQLDAFGTMETLPASLDSRVWAGSGKPVLGGFNTSHVLGFFPGSTTEAFLETGSVDGGQTRYVVKGIRPLVEGTTATTTCKIGYRDSKVGAISYTAENSANRAGIIPFRLNTRYPSVYTRIAAGGDWEHLVGFDLDMATGGKL